jgi:hypothetical protein
LCLLIVLLCTCVNPCDSPLYADGAAVEPEEFLSNLLNLRETKELYAVSSPNNDDLLNKTTYRNVLSNVVCRGILKNHLKKIEGINTTTIYLGNDWTLFIGHL